MPIAVLAKSTILFPRTVMGLQKCRIMSHIPIKPFLRTCLRRHAAIAGTQVFIYSCDLTMPDDTQFVFHDFVQRLIGHKVSYASLFLNSLRICVDRQLKEATGLFLWFEPVWHLGSSKGVLVGSRQAQAEERDTHAVLNRVVEELVGREIETMKVEPLTNDIEVRFSGGYWVKTFVSDPEANENWYIRDCRSNQVVRGSSLGLSERTAEHELVKQSE
jgi:hypothetical protein